MSAVPSTVDQQMRDRISMARMLCVLGMIFVHVPDGQSLATVYTLTGDRITVLLEGFIVEGPGRASAALLSAISGYLAATTLLKPGSSVWALYRRRFVSIIIPMIFWAGITTLVYLMVSQSRPTFLDDADTLMDKLNIIFFLTEMPVGATMHLGFLRDLFVCVLLSPILVPAVQRIAWLILPILFVFYLFVHNQEAVVILRPLILFAFTLGIFLATRHVRLGSLDRFCPGFILLWIAATMAILLAHSDVGEPLVRAFAARGVQFDETVLYPLGRLFGSLAIWTLIPRLLGGRLQAWSVRFTPYLFAAFCSHYLMLTLLFYGAWQPLFGSRESDAYLLWFMAAPFVAMAVAVVVVQISLRISPPLATLLTGGRMKTLAQVPSALGQRRRQGAALGLWMVLSWLSRSVVAPALNAVREWIEVSRQLLLGRR